MTGVGVAGATGMTGMTGVGVAGATGMTGMTGVGVAGATGMTGAFDISSPTAAASVLSLLNTALGLTGTNLLSATNRPVTQYSIGGANGVWNNSDIGAAIDTAPFAQFKHLPDPGSLRNIVAGGGMKSIKAIGGKTRDANDKIVLKTSTSPKKRKSTLKK
jgi:hypothetical protein